MKRAKIYVGYEVEKALSTFEVNSYLARINS